jgi:gluconokinase
MQGRAVSRRDWFLGIDLGTGSSKAVVVDEDGNVLGFGSVEYAAEDVERKWVEQDPEILLRAAVEAGKMASEAAGVPPHRCAGMSLGGALHTLTALDSAGNPLMGVMTWADTRAADEAFRVRKEGRTEELYRETGCPPHAMYPFYKLLWLRAHRNEIFSKASRWVSAKEYVLWKMTGEVAVDPSVASGSGLLHVRSLRWSRTCLEMAGVKEGQLSQLRNPTERLKGLRRDVAEAMKVHHRVPVFLGSSDAVNSSLGAGAVGKGQATCMVGTSGALRIISREPLLDPKVRTWCYAIGPEYWLVGGAINNGGVALSWLRDLFNTAMSFSRRKETLEMEDLMRLAEQAPTGAGGVVCLPFLAGERSPNWNSHASGAFIGLRLEHGPQHLIRAVLEGVGYRLRSIMEALQEMDISIREASASGGFTRSSLWLQIVSDVLGIDLNVPKWGETSAVGAAFWAMLGAGRVKSIEEFSSMVKIGERFSPIQENRGPYERTYAVYKELYSALEPSFQELSGIREKT